MRKSFVFTMLVLALCACSSRRLPVAVPLKETLPVEAKCSAGFRLFWKDYVDDVNQSVRIMDVYQPSAGLVADYSLRQDGRTTYVSGFITVISEKFSEDVAVGKGIHVKKMTDDTYTYSCDIRLLPLLLELEGIEYIELAKKVNPVKR